MENNQLKNFLNTDISEFESFLLFHEQPETFKELLKFCNRSSLIALTKVLTKSLKNKQQLENAVDYLDIILNLYKKEPADEVMSDLGNVLTLLLLQNPNAFKNRVLALNEMFENNLELINSKFLKMVAAIITAYAPENMDVLEGLQDKIIDGLLGDVFPEEYMYCISILLSAPRTEATLLWKIAQKASANLHVWCCLFDKMIKHKLVNPVELLKPIQESLRSDSDSRKQALFLIKMMMDSHLLSDQQKTWKKFVIIVENLEEKQSHLILPALELIPEMKFDEPAWRQILLELILKHENSLVIQWGIKFCFSNQIFDGASAQNHSLMQIFLTSLNKTGLYGRSQHSDQIVDLKALNKFVGENFELVIKNVQSVNWLSVPFYFILCEVKNHLVANITMLTIDTLENLAMTAKKVQNLQIRHGVQLILSDMLQDSAENFQINQLWKVMELIFQISENETANNTIVGCLKNVTADDASAFLELEFSSQFRELIFTEFLIQKKFPQESLPKIGIIFAVRVARGASAKDSSFKTFYLEKVNCLLTATIRQMMFGPYGDEMDKMCEELKFNQNKGASAAEINNYEACLCSYLNNTGFVDSVKIPILNLLFHHPAIQNDLGLFNAACSYLNSACIDDYNITNINCHVEILHTALICFQHLGLELDHEKVLNNCMTLIEKASESKLVLIIEILAAITIKIEIEDTTKILLLETAIARLFSEVFAIKNYHTFFGYYRSLLKLLFASLQQGWSIKIVTKYHKFVITQVGPYNTKIVALFYDKLFDKIQWIDHDLQQEIVKSGMLYGENLTREQRIELAVCKTISDGDEFFKKRFVIAEDKMIRIKCALFMKSLYINGKGGSMNIMEDFLQDFEKLSNQKPRYFPNSKMHCLKQRYLAPLVFCEKITEATMNILMQEIQHQNNQPNINYLLEILLAKCLVQRKNADIVFEVLESDNNLKAPNLQSLFVVLFLFCEAMKRKKLGDRAIEAILPYTMGKNFGTRLYSQITALQLIETFDEGDMDLFHKIIKKSFKIGNAAKHYAKIQEDFRYSCMNYDRLLTIDMAYHHLPRIGGMSDDEIITYEMFQKAVQELAWIDPPDDPTNKTDQFFHNHYYKEKLEIWSKHLMPKDCSMEQVPVVADSKVENLIVSEELAINSVINGSGNGTNVQQKIMPYKFQMPNKSLLATISRAADLESKCKLVVVASLVTRLPNLGGLARSCEIFGVQDYIIDSLKHMENTNFKSLSKSAEKWLKISEIKPWQLFDYLLHMKQQGYCIIGAEQTASSQNVIAAKIPRKSILLLGDEKEGIPANLLSLLDITLEIPQVGVLRSLNVHVCGAIIMYEYAKQHIF